jgi:iron complex transport system permease protein
MSKGDRPPHSMKRSPLTRRKTIVTIGALFVVLLIVAVGSLLIGSTAMSLGDLWRVVAGPSDTSTETFRIILVNIRLPRVLLALIVGAGLSVAGATLQALLRNPLAEPYILGISSGGTVGALIAMMAGIGMAHFTTPLFSFVGSGLVMLLVFVLGHRRGVLDTNALLLSGVMVGAFFSAMVLLFTALVNQDIRTTYLWLIGNLSSADMQSFWIVAPLIFLASVALSFQSRHFNLISTGDETAMHLGVEVDKVKRMSYLLASFITGLAVSVSGVVGFVGLVVPHACRLMFGPDHRLLLPASFLAGASYLVACDLLSRIVLAPSEVPVGVITSVLGAPIFIYLLKKNW